MKRIFPGTPSYFRDLPERENPFHPHLRLSFRADLKKWDIFSVPTRNPPLPHLRLSFRRPPPPVTPGGPEKMGHFFSSDPESTVALRLSFRCPPPPVIPGGPEKMGHFFSSDPESTVAPPPPVIPLPPSGCPYSY
ncbi:hypothetical protein QUF72_21060, partial [Desulfobacterales bacterium HSG2]|nr:hypothetical protein [Desulfobacterales bacterium HSG2]